MTISKMYGTAVDFCFDFDKYSRQREYPCVNTHELLKHIPKEMLPIFLELALLRQLIRYSPYGRPNVLFWNYVEFFKQQLAKHKSIPIDLSL